MGKLTRIMTTLLCLSVTIVLGFQNAASQTKDKAVVVPEGIYLPITVAQLDCPLRFDQAMVVKYLDGRTDEIYRIKNVGHKAIQSFSYATLTATGLEGTYSYSAKNPIMPDALVPPDETKGPDLIPLTEELRDKLKLRGPMKEAVIFMIVNVEFVDGSRFDDAARYAKIRQHIRELRLMERTEDPRFDPEPTLRSLKTYINSIG